MTLCLLPRMKAGVINLETALRLRDIDALKVAKSIVKQCDGVCVLVAMIWR